MGTKKTEAENKGVKCYYVYVHKKKGTDEVFYVGKGKGHRAFEDHKGRRSKLWELHAKDGFDVEILEENLSNEEAFSLEVNHIARYKSLGMAMANVTIGGKGINVEKRWWNDKISKSLTGRIKPSGKLNKSYKDNISKEKLIDMYVNKKMSTTEIGESCNLSYGTVIDRLNTYGIKLRKSGRKSVRIKCLNDGREFNSLSGAAKHYGVYRENISKVLKGKYEQTGGYKFSKI